MNAISGPDWGFAAIRSSVRPPTWRGGETTFTYCLTAGEPDRQGYLEACGRADATGLPNPRVLTPGMVSWASLLQPAFYAAARDWADAPALVFTPNCPARDEAGQTLHWLGSSVFLAGVTLSAAIIQNRFSAGTLVSKLDRLWHAAVAAETSGLEAVQDLALKTRVADLALRLGGDPVAVLFELKALYAEALGALSPRPMTWEVMKAANLDPEQARRFGFCEALVRSLGGQVVCVVVYGSSVQSAAFADYDLIVVVRDRGAALRALAGASPSYQGVELNISLFDEAEFEVYQALSGDNLSHHGLCLWGEIKTPRKGEAELLHRNFSFGYVRMRQIIGMRFPAVEPGRDPADDRANLYGYFAKIPLNVARGLRGALGQTVTKEGLLQWAREDLGYAVPTQDPAGVSWRDTMASAAWATHTTLASFNAQHCVYAEGG